MSYNGSAMTPTEFRTLRLRMGITQAELAQRMGVTDRSVRRYEAGDCLITETIAILLKMLARKTRAVRPRHDGRMSVMPAESA